MNFQKKPAFLLTSLITLIGATLLLAISKPIAGALFFFPFSLGPLFISMIFATSSTSTISQIILSIGSILYAAWFGYVYLSAFHWHPDPQSAIALIFVGIYSLPVMAPVWIISYMLKSHGKMK